MEKILQVKENSLSTSRRHWANADVIADVKKKSLYDNIFLPTRFFLPLQKFKTVKIKLEQIPIPKQIRAYYIFRGILKTFSNICALYVLCSLSLANCKQLRKCNCLSRSSLFATFFFFFFFFSSY